MSENRARPAFAASLRRLRRPVPAGFAGYGTTLALSPDTEAIDAAMRYEKIEFNIFEENLQALVYGRPPRRRVRSAGTIVIAPVAGGRRRISDKENQTMQNPNNIPNPDVNSVPATDEYGNRLDIEQENRHEDLPDVPLPPTEPRPAPVEEPPAERPRIDEPERKPTQIV